MKDSQSVYSSPETRSQAKDECLAHWNQGSTLPAKSQTRWIFDCLPMKILLTGANGYIGLRLLPILLEAGHSVVCLFGIDGVFQ